MIRRPPRSTRKESSAASDVYKRQEITNEISEKDDFDFHTSSIIKLLGMKGSLKTAQTLISGELKKIWN